MDLIPIYDATAPVSCSAGPGELADRIDTIERLHASVHRVERTEHGLLLHFPNRPDVEAEVRRFAVDEKGCCQFWGFAIETAPGTLALRWDGPPGVDELLDRLLDYFDGHDPEAINELL